MMLKSPRNYSSSYQPVVLANDTRTGDDELRELRKASRWTKLRPFCIFIPTGISLCVLVLHTRQYKNSGKLYEWSTSSRTLVQVVVHILSSILAVFWTYSICNLISHWTRHRISNHSVNLNTLRLWSALRQGRTDWDLPWIFTLATLAFFTLTYIPATLWAGALTPSVSRKSVSGLSLLVPGSGANHNYSYLEGSCWTAQQSNGTFTNCLKSRQTGNLLRSVATASSLDDMPTRHDKWDNTRFQYVTRSFGVGSAAGLTDRHIAALGNIRSYTYNEVGFDITTQCIRNESSVMWWRLDTNNTGTLPNQYVAIGALPNSNWSKIKEGEGRLTDGWDFYAQSAFNNTDLLVSTFNRVPIDNDTRWMFGMVAGSNYTQLNKTQCESIFRPSLFSVEVSITNSTINVSSIPSAEVNDPDPTKQLRVRAADSYSLSFVTNSLYTSSVGDAFLDNISNKQVRESIPTNLEDSKYIGLVLESIADSVTAVMENSLVALGGATLTRFDATQTVNATAVISAVQIGSKPFIWAVFVINIIGLVAVLAGYCLLWREEVPLFDYCDLGCMAFGIMQGVVVLAHRTKEMAPQEIPWDGDSRDERIGNLTAKLKYNAVEENDT